MKKQDSLDKFAKNLNGIIDDFKIETIKEYASHMADYYSNKGCQPDIANYLQDSWYKSLAVGAPNYNVYQSESFLGEAWACWWVYTRKIIDTFFKKYKILSNRVVADLGNGIGLSTKQIQEYVGQKTYGTNVPGPQFSYAQKKLGVFMRSIPIAVTSYIFAFEYFEHFENPIKHLDYLMEKTNAIGLVCANAFGSKSVGHFDVYKDEKGMSVSNKVIGRKFSARLKHHGFWKVDTGFWNNRPQVWTRKSDAFTEIESGDKRRRKVHQQSRSEAQRV